MLLVDDILFSPVRGLLWIFREIHQQAQKELAEEPEAIAQQLRNLYMQLETGAASEEDFEKREKQLLDRLDEIQAHGELTGDEEADSDEEAESDEQTDSSEEALSGEEESEEDAPHAGQR